MTREELREHLDRKPPLECGDPDCEWCAGRTHRTWRACGWRSWFTAEGEYLGNTNGPVDGHQTHDVGSSSTNGVQSKP